MRESGHLDEAAPAVGIEGIVEKLAVGKPDTAPMAKQPSSPSNHWKAKVRKDLDNRLRRTLGSPENRRTLGNPENPMTLGNPESPENPRTLGNPENRRILGNPENPRILGNPDFRNTMKSNRRHRQRRTWSRRIAAVVVERAGVGFGLSKEMPQVLGRKSTGTD